MPAPGDQHQSWKNPFEEERAKMSMWTAQEIATIASRLDKQLGPEYISARAGPGGQRVHYLTAEKCITLANEVFGFNGWSSSIQNIQVDFADENPQTQRVSIGLSVIVRVTLRDGTYHEDIGYGSIENAKGKAMAFEKAKKEGTTDGLKRALRSFGNVLGNCIYDQDYVRQVVKHKAQPVKKFDPNNLHRHSDFVKDEPPPAPAPAPAPVQRQQPAPAPAAAATPASRPQSLPPPPPPQQQQQQQAKLEPSESFEDFLGELDEADFCVPGEGHPDEIVLPAEQARPQPPAPAPRQQPSRPNAPQTPMATKSTPAPQQQQNNRPQQQQQQNNRPPPPAAASASGGGDSVGFFSARAVNQLPESSFSGQSNGQSLAAPGAAYVFNPKLESPSIRKTPGIDHSSSKPVSRSGQHVPPSTAASSSQAPATTTGGGGGNGNTSSFTPVRPSQARLGGSAGGGNVVNPALDQTRRIGAPGGMGSPLGNRGSFRQPTMMKRPSPAAGDGGGARQVLADLPANAAVSGDGLDAKRQKMT